MFEVMIPCRPLRRWVWEARREDHMRLQRLQWRRDVTAHHRCGRADACCMVCFCANCNTSYLMMSQDSCLLLRQDRCLLLRQDRCLLLRQDRTDTCRCDKTNVSAIVISVICLASTADICPVSTEDIYPVSTADIKSWPAEAATAADQINDYESLACGGRDSGRPKSLHGAMNDPSPTAKQNRHRHIL